ncbi:MAG TPA: coatomer subunit epsilon [Candidatus Angelobacter sp.]|nr:coatomer subunit epsilon [Candidatus Angelobacter sp.]
MSSYTRRQLKEDKFAETASEAVHWASGHRKGMVIGVAAGLAVVLLGVGAYFWWSHQTEQANVALSKAIRTFTAPLRPAGTPPNESMQTFTSIAERGTQAEKEFKAVADGYSMTQPGKVASYMAGAAALQAGNNADAEKQLKAAAASGGRDIAALSNFALAGLYRSTNRQADAARIYKDLSDQPTNTVSKAQAQLAMAEMYEASDPKQADGIYEQVKKENADNAAGQIAAAKLAKK